MVYACTGLSDDPSQQIKAGFPATPVTRVALE
jgi:hypothetical protein